MCVDFTVRIPVTVTIRVVQITTLTTLGSPKTTWKHLANLSVTSARPTSPWAMHFAGQTPPMERRLRAYAIHMTVLVLSCRLATAGTLSRGASTPAWIPSEHSSSPTLCRQNLITREQSELSNFPLYSRYRISVGKPLRISACNRLPPAPWFFNIYHPYYHNYAPKKMLNPNETGDGRRETGDGRRV